MTAQAASKAASKLHQVALVLSYWMAKAISGLTILGMFAVLVIAVAVLLMPLGHMVLDYWSPKVQALWQPAPPGVRVMKGGRP